MQRHFNYVTRSLVFAIAAVFAIVAVYADKPAWAGNKEGKEGKQDKKDKHDKKEDREGDKGRSGRYFNDKHREVAREYYAEQFRGGRCPPGLAKKQNGCMPPGQAKKWIVGRPLPREVVYYEVPQQVVVRFGPPPSGQRYVRVASDILLIAIGTGMVLDALQDLQR